MALLNFDASQVQPNEGGLDPVPAGWYNVNLIESDIAPTKDGAGRLLNLKFTILDGQFANRKIYNRLNIVNANPTAQEIARGQLSALCHACGVIQVADSAQLHGIPLKVRVKITPAKDGYEAKNEITAFKNINDVVDMPLNPPLNAANPFAQKPQSMPPQRMPTFAPQQQQPQFTQAPQPWQQPQTAVAQPTLGSPVPTQMAQQPVQAAQAPFQQAQNMMMGAAATQFAASPGASSPNTMNAQSQASPAVQAQPQQPPWANVIPQQAAQQQTEPVESVQGGPEVAQEAVQQVQTATPPWLKPAV